MKRISIAGLSAVVILAAAPLVGVIPGIPSFSDLGSANAQNIQNQSQLQLRLEAEKQVVAQDQQGKQKVSWKALQGKAVVQPGDVLRYTLSGENTSDRPLKNLTLNQPIPKGMVYVLKSATINAKDAKISYSIDGGRTFVVNPTVKVTLSNGKVETKPAPATAYTHIRMNFGSIVPAKSTIKATYQVQVR